MKLSTLGFVAALFLPSQALAEDDPGEWMKTAKCKDAISLFDKPEAVTLGKLNSTFAKAGFIAGYIAGYERARMIGMVEANNAPIGVLSIKETLRKVCSVRPDESLIQAIDISMILVIDAQN